MNGMPVSRRIGSASLRPLSDLSLHFVLLLSVAGCPAGSELSSRRDAQVSFDTQNPFRQEDGLIPETDGLVPPPGCGDGKCGSGENCATCPADCNACPSGSAVCGDGTCGSGETCVSCAADCGECPPQCGDGTCNGSETCSTCPGDCGDCPVDPCAQPETLNGKDDNCNGLVDEGFWATPFAASAADLSTVHPGCTDSAPFSLACNSAINRYCRNRKYTSGFGPVELGGTRTVICVADASYLGGRSIADLTAIHPGCKAGTALHSIACRSAINRYCRQVAGSFQGGFGPVEASSQVDVVCVRHGKVHAVSWAALSAEHSGCTYSPHFSVACNAAVSRYCKKQGHRSGHGPVEANQQSANILCVDQQ